MDDGTFLRVFAFEPSRPGLIDTTLRESLLPELRERDGLIDAFVARHGPDEIGERVIVSVWESASAMQTGADESGPIARRHAEYADGIAGVRVQVHPVAVRLVFGRTDPPRILRIFQGEVLDGRLDDYLEDVRTGALADGGSSSGLTALYLGVEPPLRFQTVSAWTDWDAIEAATGGNIQHPIMTRFPERIRIIAATHYEILPGTANPAADQLQPAVAAS
jgi:heme-degrading monooxygenase HmoA